MKPQLDNLVFPSVRLWIDYLLATKGEAYSNTTQPLYKIDGEDYHDKFVYGSPNYQWIFDSSITDADVPSEVTFTDAGVKGRADGIRIDFDGGRIISDSDFGDTGSIDCSVKEINTYLTTKSDVELFLETKFEVEPEMLAADGALKPNQLVAPCIFIRTDSTSNEDLGFGGRVFTKIVLRLISFSNTWQWEAMKSIFRDVEKEVIPYFEASQLPIDEYGDLKGGVAFNYETLRAANNTEPYLMHIDDVNCSSYENDNISEHNRKITIGFYDITLKIARNPRSA